MAVAPRVGWFSISWLIALIVLIVVIILFALDRLALPEAALFGALAICWLTAPWQRA